MREFTLKNICYLFFLLSLSSNGPLHASPSQSLLNSERIEQRFGDFGIEVLEADSQTRISNLYSMDSAGATMRTLAIVNFIAATDPHLAAEHRRIIAGESIGAVFQESGWHIEKVTLAPGIIRVNEPGQITEPRIDRISNNANGIETFGVKEQIADLTRCGID